MHQERARDHRATNAAHSLVLLAGMGLLFVFLGYLLIGPSGALVAGGGALIVLWFSPRVAPRLIMRLYRAVPLHWDELGPLQEVLTALTRRAGLPSRPELYYLPTQVMNAFTVGDPRQSAIAVTDGLLRALNMRELTGVMAHEVSHLRHNDLRVMTLADMIARMTSTLSLFGQIMLLVNLPLLFMGGARISWLAILAMLAAPSLAAMLQLALSRTREFDADVGAVELTGDALGLASALEKMERYQRGFFETILVPGGRNPDPSLLRTHPATRDRIERLLEVGGRRTPEAPRPQPVHYAVPGRLPPVRRAPNWHVSGLWH